MYQPCWAENGIVDYSRNMLRTLENTHMLSIVFGFIVALLKWREGWLSSIVHTHMFPIIFGFIFAEDGFCPVQFLQLELQTTFFIGFDLF